MYKKKCPSNKYLSIVFIVVGTVTVLALAVELKGGVLYVLLAVALQLIASGLRGLTHTCEIKKNFSQRNRSSSKNRYPYRKHADREQQKQRPSE